MPTISVDREDLFNALNYNYTTEEFEELCFNFGLELEKDTSESKTINEIPERPQFKIDVPANRYDLLCFEGISRALNIFLGHQKAPEFKLSKPEKLQLLYVSEETAKIRPYISAVILRELNFTKSRYESFISLQEKLHSNICRNRSLVSIGTHDLDTIQGPFSYEAHKPEKINFIPLNQKKSFNMVELFEFYKNDKHIGKFLHLIENSPIYPVIYDSNRVVCSLPPIINSEHSKITLNTKNVLIEVTGTDQTKLEIVTNIMVAMFSCYSKDPFTIEPVHIKSPHNQCSRIWPKVEPYINSVKISYINSCCGLDLSAAEISKLLERMGLSSKQSTIDPELLDVFVPITRADILHQCDIMEDVAIAYGYNRLKKVFTNKIATTGKPLPLNKLTDIIRKECSMAGWSEVMPLVLCSYNENFNYLGKTSNSLAIILENPKTSDYQVVRTSLIPGLLKTIRENKKHVLPMKIFEVSDIVLQNKNEETLCKNKRLWSAAYFSNASGFEIIHGLLDRIMNMLNTNNVTPEDKNPGYWIQCAEEPIFLKGRCAKVFLRLKNMLEINVGIFGILHPNVLKAFEIPFVGSILEIDIENWL
ncbi:phenylalanine-tRNA ligase, beta subunit [Pneumocystis jirovecii RU7]|uniref:Phenylalanine--tRNA ligase beta subunit n=1 Tax=Pneumocystis jirovecii (strain RU7) TaxID=1408657 RepID=A0A0W4ZWL7_PNEJ7|nr:phenylalanine-tRNA ligase, beta subunit [Pneumocystis jirovecii RU7]KTW32756.1 phenylalanine-tRNA ligase, beta subunit [Pneumocystis jirovecii RU7]